MRDDKLSFREAALGDCDLFYKWRNEELVRANSFNTGIVDYDEHAKWFHGKIDNDRCKMFVLTIEEKPVGQIRFDMKEEAAEISVSICSEYRGRSLGKEGIKLLSDHIISNNYAKKILAYIKNGNDSSLKAFIATGYSIADNNCRVKDQQALKLEYIQPGVA
ncbi:GNAT family N-acetyltransferase [Candidatus Omnitrophota bacterium]